VAALVILITFKTPSAVKAVEATLEEKIMQMDFPGTALVMGASLTLLLALQYGGITHPWRSSLVIGLLVGFGLIVLALIALEMWQGERAMLTPRLLRQRSVWVSSVWGFFFAGAYFVTVYYLPIYFQSVDDRSAIGSGVRNIPLIALFSISTFASGLAITKTGIAAPLLVVSSVVVTISAGLLYTLDVGTSTGKWVGYQMLAGFGYGMGLQIPVIIAQAFAAPTDIAPVTAIIICEFQPHHPTISSIHSVQRLSIAINSRSIYRRHIHDCSCAVQFRQSALAQAQGYRTKRPTRIDHIDWCDKPAPRISRHGARWRDSCVRMGYQNRLCDHYRLVRDHCNCQLSYKVGECQQEERQRLSLTIDDGASRLVGMTSPNRICVYSIHVGGARFRATIFCGDVCKALASGLQTCTKLSTSNDLQKPRAHMNLYEIRNVQLISTSVVLMIPFWGSRLLSSLSPARLPLLPCALYVSDPVPWISLCGRSGPAFSPDTFKSSMLYDRAAPGSNCRR
jgi:hypothetical protein